MCRCFEMHSTCEKEETSKCNSQQSHEKATHRFFLRADAPDVVLPPVVSSMAVPAFEQASMAVPTAQQKEAARRPSSRLLHSTRLEQPRDGLPPHPLLRLSFCTSLLFCAYSPCSCPAHILLASMRQRVHPPTASFSIKLANAHLPH